MVLHFIHREESGMVGETEGLATKVALIISNLLVLENSISYFMSYYRDVFPESDMEYLAKLVMRFPPGSQEHKTFSDLQKTLRKLNVKAHSKHPDIMRPYNVLKKKLSEIKANDKASVNKEMAKKKFAELLNFFDGERIDLQPVKRINSAESQEDPYINWLKFLLCKMGNILVLDMKQEYYPNNVIIDGSNPIICFDKMPDYISFPLYKIHDISELTYEQLNYTRINILQKVNDFNTRMKELRAEIVNIDFTAEYLGKMTELLNQKLCGFQDLQDVIDNELYIQKAKNSGVKLCAEVSLCVSSIRNIAGYYEKNGMLKPYVASVLYNRLEVEDLSLRGGIFLNISIVKDEE